MIKASLYLIIVLIIAAFSLAGCKEEAKTEELEAKIAKLEEEIEAAKEEITGEKEEEHSVAQISASQTTAKISESITFSAKYSTDMDGNINSYTYTWDFGDGYKGSGVSLTHTYAEAGEYTVSLTVKDESDALSSGVTTTATVEAAEEEEIVEEDQATPPEQTVIAEAGDDKIVYAGDKITFDASASEISPLSNETVVTYSWDWDGDGTYDETTEEAVITHNFEETGTYEVALKVTAFDNISSTDTLTVTISDINENPIADPGGPYTATAGEEITFDGSASSDSEGGIARYIWDLGDGSTGSGVSPTHTYTEAGQYTVSLTVEDNEEALSAAVSTTATVEAAEEEEIVEEVVEAAEENYPVNTSPITNITGVVGYREVTVDQLVKIFENRNSTKVEWARRIAPLYIEYGKLFNMRPDIAWAQMCHETGFLEYTGDVSPDQKNFVGMGATGGGVPGNSFATEELGIIAHYAHLAWYYYPDHVNIYCSTVYDPRHFGSYHYKYTGDTTLGFLNGKWAPGSTYTNKIILFANQIYGF